MDTQNQPGPTIHSRLAKGDPVIFSGVRGTVLEVDHRKGFVQIERDNGGRARMRLDQIRAL